MKMLAKKAVQKLDTLKPDTRDATSRIISALITSRNRPKVKNVSGKVSTMSSGLTMALAKPSNSAEMIKEAVLLKRMPWNSRLAIQSAIAVMAQCRRKGERLLTMKVILGVRRLAGVSSYCPKIDFLALSGTFESRGSAAAGPRLTGPAHNPVRATAPVQA